MFQIQKDLPYCYRNSLTKRCLDLAICIPALIFFSPIFVLIYLCVRGTSRGPGFFCQQRYGRGLTKFSVIKFRTMYDHKTQSKFAQATKRDPRITFVGKFLRHTSLDELPQLINVLAGDMSIVGPRPHVIEMDDQAASQIPNFFERYHVKPGMTGLAQISGQRGPTPTRKHLCARLSRDLDYTHNASLLLDIKIILQTPTALFVGKNAF